MSVMTFDDDRYSQIFEALRVKGNDLGWLFGYPEGWDKYGGLDFHIKTFVTDLRRANILTWNRQYPDDILTVDELVFQPRCPYTNIQLYKALCAIRYNLCDNGGKETDISNCLKRLNHLIDSVASGIIDTLPEYQEASWM